jgi:hypothetical protein
VVAKPSERSLEPRLISAGKIPLDEALSQLESLVKPAQRKRARQIYEAMHDRMMKEIDGGEDLMAMCTGMAVLAKYIIASTPLAVAPASGDRKLDIALDMRLGEALLRFRKTATAKEIRASDADRDRLVKVVFHEAKDGTASLSMAIAVMTLAVEVLGSSMRFLN